MISITLGYAHIIINKIGGMTMALVSEEQVIKVLQQYNPW